MGKITIIGAGMAGLLAGAMLRNEVAQIWEAQPDLPNNHSALLRFRSSIVGDTLNIPFKKVQVMKASDRWRNPVADALSYSIKTNGTATLRSSTTANGQIDERYIAPTNLIQQMADRLQTPIDFNSPFSAEDSLGLRVMACPIISTLPMPVLADLFDIDHPEFKWVEGYNINVDLVGVDAYVTLYIPDRAKAMNRISITGNRLTIECALPGIDQATVAGSVRHRNESPNLFEVEDCLELLGLNIGCYMPSTYKVSQQRYAKILPVDERWRKEFIMKMSREYGIFSLGRFATWRPGLLLDDVVNDVRVIQRIIRDGAYDHVKG